MRIRSESSEDVQAVRSINESAFETSAEADLVEALRELAAPVISLVADEGGRLVGHIMFSPVVLPGDMSLRIMGLAPMAVSRPYQRQGVGSALVRTGLEACKALGSDAVVVLGHAEYYPRFGFTPASGFDIGCAYEVPDEAFMAIELRPGCFDGAAGKVAYHAAFDQL